MCFRRKCQQQVCEHGATDGDLGYVVLMALSHVRGKGSLLRLWTWLAGGTEQNQAGHLLGNL